MLERVLLYVKDTLFPVSKEEFFEAASRGNVEVIKKYIEQNKEYPALINVVDDWYGNTVLNHALKHGQAEIVRLLLAETEIDLNLANNNGDTALILSTRKKNALVVKTLLANPDINVNARNKQGETALIIASKDAETEIINDLLNVPSLNVNSANKFGETSLMIALMTPKEEAGIDIVNTLLALPDLDVNTANESGETALMIALLTGNVVAVNALLDHPDIKLETAIELGKKVLLKGRLHDRWQGAYRADVIKAFLIIPGIDVNITDAEGNTPLMIAVIERNIEIVRSLASFPDIAVNTTNNEGDTALILGAKKDAASIVKTLANFHGIDVNVTNKQGNTALIEATKVRYINADIVNTLVGVSDINPNIADKAGDTPLILAVLKRYPDPGIVKSLLSAPGIDINATDSVGNTALMLASFNGFNEIVDILVANPDINVNAANNKGRTALIGACEDGKTAIVKALLAVSSIDINAVNSHGDSALRQAIAMGGSEYGFADIIVTLLHAGADYTALNYIGINDGLIDFLKIENAVEQELYLFNKIRSKVTGNAEMMNAIAKLSLRAAIADIKFLPHHREKIQDFSLLPELLIRVSLVLIRPEMCTEQMLWAADCISRTSDYIKDNYKDDVPGLEESAFDSLSNTSGSTAISKRAQKYITAVTNTSLDNYSMAEKQFNIFCEKRLSAVAEIQGLNRLAGLSFKSAIKSIRFVRDNKFKIIDKALLSELLFEFSELLRILTDGDKTLDQCSRAMMIISAIHGHAVAKHIVDHYYDADPSRAEADTIQVQNISSASDSAGSSSKKGNGNLKIFDRQPLASADCSLSGVPDELSQHQSRPDF